MIYHFYLKRKNEKVEKLVANLHDKKNLSYALEI